MKTHAQIPDITTDRSPLVDVRLRVDILDAEDLAYWAALFDVTSHEIRHAARHVGADVAAVERFIRFAADLRPATPHA